MALPDQLFRADLHHTGNRAIKNAVSERKLPVNQVQAGPVP
jgi:hypothetical protein